MPDDSTRDVVVLSLLGWLFPPVVVFFLVKDILELNAATGQAPEIVTAFRRRVILVAVATIITLFISFAIVGPLMTPALTRLLTPAP